MTITQTSTTATLLTPRAPGAIAIIQLRGSAAPAILATLTSPPLPQKKISLVHFLANNQEIDQGLVVQLNPETFELHLHGGLAVVDAILNALTHAGAVRLPDSTIPGSSLEAEIHRALPLALLPTTLHLLAAQQTSGLHRWLANIANQLHATPALWKLQSQLQWLLDRSQQLNHLLHTPRIAIIGPPNAGKSTLANAFLGRPSSITSPTAGTTRDWIDAPAILQSHTTQLSVTLIDTAGIRATTDPIEQEAIARTHAQAAKAALLLVVLDGSAPLTPDLLAWLSSLDSLQIPTIIAINKIDQPVAFAIADVPRIGRFIPISAMENLGLAELQSAISEALCLNKIAPNEPWAFSPALRIPLQNIATAPTLPAFQTAFQTFYDLLTPENNEQP